MLPYATATKHTLARYLPTLEVHSKCNFHYFLWFPFLLNWVIGVIRQSSFTHAPIHAKFTIAIPGPLVLPSNSSPPSAHMTHSNFIIQGDHLHTTCQLSQLFLSLSLLNSNEKVVEVSSALYFWDHNTPNQIVAKPTKALEPVWRSVGTQVMKVHHNLLSAS